MNSPRQPLSSIQLYLTAEYPCSYLDNKQARSQVIAAETVVDQSIYSQLLRFGFRRSGAYTYRPMCDSCKACTPIRVDIQAFAPSRSQKRVLKKHQYLHISEVSLGWNEEHYFLYKKYLAARHLNGGMDDDSEEQYKEFLLNSQINTRIIEFRDHKHKLKMVSIIDIADDALSAVYTYYDPNDNSGLGTYNILWQIELCKTLKLNWLYLGYWIKECRKMSYKTHFLPAQVLFENQWQDYHTESYEQWLAKQE